ncbi:MAG: membrane protease subunit HflK [Oleispira sp.]|jgi:membrane protease subunit HflK
MAWNEPGGDKNDPWKNRGGKEQGPPDLDEVLKNLFSKFTKSGGSGGGGNGKSYTGLGLGLLAAIIVVVWGLSGFYTIKEAERGVILRFGENTGQLAQPGLSWKMTFIDEIIPINVQNISSLGSAGAMLTEDENMVRVEMEMQYRIADPYLWRFSVTDPEQSLSQALDSAIRYVVGHMKMDDILTDGREDARQRVRDELNSIVGAYNIGVSIIDMNFKDARPPQEVKAAFDDAIAAQEDEVRFIREAEAYAREIEPRARGQVNRMNEEAQAFKERSILEAQGEVARFEELLPQYQAAPIVTRQRIYLETMEEVFSSTSKIIVDTEGSGNMMYLPLDKIMDRSTSQTQAQRAQNRNTLEGLRNSPAAEELLNSTQDNDSRSIRQGRN